MNLETVAVQSKPQQPRQRRLRSDAKGRTPFLIRVDPGVLALLKLRAQMEQSNVNEIVNVELRDATAHLSSNEGKIKLPL